MSKLLGLRRIEAPKLAAAAAAFIGLVGVVSTLTPETASRSHLIDALLPPGWTTAARTLTLALGFALLWVARGLARRKRRAWVLAVAFVVASAVVHLVKGLDLGAVAAALVVLLLLVRTRREFVAPGDPASVRPLLQVGFALALIVPIAALHAAGTVAFSDRLDDALLLVIGALLARALILWLNPIAESVRQIPAERRRAAELVQTYGSDSLAYFALRRDKSIFLSASRRSFLAYRVVAGTAIIAGDPVGDVSERAELIEEFRRVAHAKAWRVAIAGASAQALPDYAGSASVRSTSATRRSCGPSASRSKAGRSARCASRSRGWRRPATASRSSRPATSRPSGAASCSRSRSAGGVVGRNGASRWRWTPSSATPTP